MKISGIGLARFTAVSCLWVFGLGADREISAQPISAGFGWKTAQSGSLSTASNWEVNDERLMVKPFVDNTATVPPRSGDSVLFPNVAGAYTVDLTGAPPLKLFYFNGISQASFVLSGGLVVDEFFTPTAGTILFRGGGSLTAAKFYYSGGQMILEGVLGRLHGIPLAGGGGSSDPAHRNRLLLVRQGGKLVTTGRANVPSVTLEDGSEWDHQGEPENCCGVTLLGGSRFKAAVTESRSGGMYGAGASTFQIDDFTGYEVQLSSGSRMMNRTATAGSDPQRQTTFVDGPGSVWQVDETFSVLGANAVFIRNGGTMTIGRGHFDNFGGGALVVTGTGSSLQIRESLEIENYGTVRAETGGLVTLPQARFRGTGAFLISKGPGAEFRASGPLVLHRGTVQVREGGRGNAPHLTVHEGTVQVWHPGSVLTLAGNLEVGIEGVAQADIDAGAKIMSGAGFVGGTQQGEGTVSIEGSDAEWDLKDGGFIGDAGKGLVFLTEGGKLKASGQGAGLALGFGTTGKGTVRISTKGALDARSATVAVGMDGEGLLSINGEGSMTARDLLIGESAFTNRVLLSGSGATLTVLGELVAGNGGTGVLQLRQGARAETLDLRVGVESTHRSGGVGVGTVSIEGENSLLTVADRFSIGSSEIGVLAVSSGAHLVFQGEEAVVGGEGVGVLAVTGAQSRMDAVAGVVQVGVQGVGTLEVSNGGQLRSRAGKVGMDNAGQVIVGNRDARWEVGGDLEIGIDDVAVFTLDDQAEVRADKVFAGRQEGATATVFVLRQALWRVEKELAIAEAGAAAMVLQNGGRLVLQAGPLDLASMPQGRARLSIELPGSILSASNSLADIGGRGEAGVQIVGGGQFHTGPARIGVEANALGQVFVAGPGSRWTVEGELHVGGEGQALLKVDDRGEVVVHGPLILGPGAALEGEGTILATEFIHSGVISPGHSPGTLRLEGSLRLQPASRTIIEIGGVEAGARHDVVNVLRGQVSLGGQLVLKFINGFAPLRDQVFSFLTAAGGIAGSFSEVLIEGLAPGFQQELRPSSDGTRLALAALSDGVAASEMEQPRLSITRFGPQIVVECASPTPGFILQTSTLGTPTTWSSIASNAHRLSFSPNDRARLFRMVQP